MEKEHKEQTKPTMLHKVVVAISMSIILSTIFLLCTKEEVEKPEDNCVEAYVMAKSRVKDALKSPSTADFPFSDYKCTRDFDSNYVITSYVDSQNEFGATVRTRFQVVLRYKSGKVIDPNNWEIISFVTN